MPLYLPAGSTTRSAQTLIATENIALVDSVPWAKLTTSVGTGSVPLQGSIAASAGDRIRVDLTFMRTGTGFFLDLALLTSAGAIGIYFGSRTSSPLAEGNPSFYPQAGTFPAATATLQIVVQSAQIDGSGNATVAMVYRGGGTQTVYASSTYPWYLLLTNIGAEPA
jgi:hypothetical protein